eukprot:SAG31_NODE_454_length_15434_cov_39.578285_6_plen_167_part_00
MRTRIACTSPEYDSHATRQSSENAQQAEQTLLTMVAEHDMRAAEHDMLRLILVLGAAIYSSITSTLEREHSSSGKLFRLIRHALVSHPLESFEDIRVSQQRLACRSKHSELRQCFCGQRLVPGLELRVQIGTRVVGVEEQRIYTGSRTGEPPTRVEKAAPWKRVVR